MHSPTLRERERDGCHGWTTNGKGNTVKSSYCKGFNIQRLKNHPTTVYRGRDNRMMNLMNIMYSSVRYLPTCCVIRPYVPVLLYTTKSLNQKGCQRIPRWLAWKYHRVSMPENEPQPLDKSGVSLVQYPLKLTQSLVIIINVLALSCCTVTSHYFILAVNFLTAILQNVMWNVESKISPCRQISCAEEAKGKRST